MMTGWVGRILFFIFFIALVHTANAQRGRQKNRFMPVVHIGAIASQVDGDTFAGYDKPGFEAGIGVIYQRKKPVTYTLRMMYVQKGSRRRTNPDAGEFISYKMRLHYIAVPIALRYKKYRKKWFAEVGLEPEYLVKGVEFDHLGELPNRPNFNKLNVDLDIAGGYIGKKWEVSLHWTNSIIPIRNLSSKNRNFDAEDLQFNKLVKIRFAFYLMKVQRR